MRLALVACEVFTRELSAAVADAPHVVDVRFLPKDLHSRSAAAMRAELQAAVDAAAPGHDAVALGFARCGGGALGVRAPGVPLIALRAHDCIACLLGARARHTAALAEQPGTWWLSAGWAEHGSAIEPGQSETAPRVDDPRWQALVAKHGEDNAQYLWETLYSATGHYRRLAWIDTGVGPQARLTAEAEARAAQRGWEFRRHQGDPAWLRALVHGPWDDERFVVVPPGGQIAADDAGAGLRAG